MKKIISFAALVLCTLPVFSQSFFIKGGIGAGISTNSADIFPLHSLGGTDNTSEAMQFTAGYMFGHLQVETGIDYMSTIVHYRVSQFTFVLMDMWWNPSHMPARVNVKFGHLAVPLLFSYAISRHRKLSFYPGAGVETMYNFKEKRSGIEDYDRQYRKNSTAIVLKLDAQYSLNKHWGLWAGIAYHNTVTSMMPADYMSYDQSYDHALLFMSGIRYNLGKAK